MCECQQKIFKNLLTNVRIGLIIDAETQNCVDNRTNKTALYYLRIAVTARIIAIRDCFVVRIKSNTIMFFRKIATGGEMKLVRFLIPNITVRDWGAFDIF